MLYEATAEDICLSNYNKVISDIKGNVELLRILARTRFGMKPPIQSLLSLTPSPIIEQQYKATWLTWAQGHFTLVGKELTKDKSLHDRTIQSLLPVGAVDHGKMSRNVNEAILMPVSTYLEQVVTPLGTKTGRLARQLRELRIG